MRLMNLLTGSILCSALLATGTAWHGWPLGAGVAEAAQLDGPGAGRRLYLELNCYSCHGMHAAGGMGPNIQHAQSGDIAEAIRFGVPEGGMPPFPSKYTTNLAVKNLTQYLATAGGNKEPIWVDWWNPVP